MNRLHLTVFVIAFIAGLTGCAKSDPEPVPEDPRDAFTGVWGVNETETKMYYEVSVELNPSDSKSVLIYNFANAGSASNPAVASVSGSAIILEADQQIGDGWIINGSGNLSGGKVYWNYSLNDGANLHQLTAVYSRI